MTPWAPPTAGWLPPPETSHLAVPGVPGLVFAGAGPRFVAYVVDAVLLAIIGLVLTGLAGGFSVAGSSRSLGAAVAASELSPALIAANFAQVAISALYFIAFWTSGGHATVGMRLLKLQVGNAYDGHRLGLGQAIRRWLAFGIWLSLLSVTPEIGSYMPLLQLVWWIVLLATTVLSPTRQGLHDRFANTAVVAPAVGGSGALVLGCILLVAFIALIAVSSLIALLFLGSQLSTILSTMGEPVVP